MSTENDDKAVYVEYDPTFVGTSIPEIYFYSEEESDGAYLSLTSHKAAPSACLMRIPDAPAPSVYDDDDHSHIEGLIK